MPQARGEAVQLAVQGHHRGPPGRAGRGADEPQQLLQEALEQVARQPHPHLLQEPLGRCVPHCRNPPLCPYHYSDSVLCS